MDEAPRISPPYEQYDFIVENTQIEIFVSSKKSCEREVDLWRIEAAGHDRLFLELFR